MLVTAHASHGATSFTRDRARLNPLEKRETSVVACINPLDHFARQLHASVLLNFFYVFFFFVGASRRPTKIAKPTVFQVILPGIGKSFQSAITAPQMNLTGYGNATAQR